MNDKKVEKIRKEAKSILSNFAKKLKGVKLVEKDSKKEVGGFRAEAGSGEKCDSDFKKIMFENAPEKDLNCIVVEKKQW